MNRTIVALVAALFASSALADTAITNANGMQVNSAGQLEHFAGLVIGDDGKVVRLLHAGDPAPQAASVIDAHGQALLPGLIDAHGHVMDLGAFATTLNLVGTSSIADLQQRLRDYAAANPDGAWEFIKCATGDEGQTSWARDTQAQPTNIAAASDPVLAGGPGWDIVDDALATSTGGVFVQDYPNWTEQLNQRWELVWTGDLTAQEALDEAQAAVAD